jgi:nicotinamidase-related amidase
MRLQKTERRAAGSVEGGMDPFPLDRATVHLCIDMQRLFGPDGPWCVPWLPRVAPIIAEIAARHPERTIFTRFIPPAEPEQAEGAWRDYYKEWRQVTRNHLDPRLLELVPELAGFVPPAKLLDKTVYSAFGDGRLAPALKRRGIRTLVVTGGETDVCVLATVLGAIDRGFRVVLPQDALCSTFNATHDALMKLYRERFSLQIETTCTERVLADWT